MNETTFFKHGDQMEQVLYRAFGRARIPIALRLTLKHIQNIGTDVLIFYFQIDAFVEIHAKLLSLF